MRDESDPTSTLSRTLARTQKRPHLASKCEHLADAIKFRNQIIREISDKVTKIQNEGLGEHAIRDLNDGINKLIREKYHWNRRIKELGGKDYNREERRAMAAAEAGDGDGAMSSAAAGGDDLQGISLKGSGGYRYFGAAKNLPGVRELFARHAAKLTKRKRGDVYKYITPDYYGLRDEEDGVLLELESDLAKEGQKKLKECRDVHHKEDNGESKLQQSQNELYATDEDSDDDTAVLDNGIDAHVAVPSQDVVAQVILQKKKEALLSRFA